MQDLNYNNTITCNKKVNLIHAGMQPYFFPYLGYFSLIKNSDIFTLLDTVQYIKGGWIERNRILNGNNDWSYIKVPLAHKSVHLKINELKIDNTKDWKQKIICQLSQYKRVAPYYFEVLELIKDLFEKEYEDIVSLNMEGIMSILNYLQIEREVSLFSNMNLSIETPNAPDEWGLNISMALPEVNTYINPPGGKSFYDKNKYAKEGIDLKFLQINLMPYCQKSEVFLPGLSIIDVMMFNSPESINNMLDDFELS